MPDDGNPNRTAFLSMIAWSEGTSRVAGSDNGYNVLAGGKLFTSYADHPREPVFIPKLNLYTTAAGRYQLLARWFDAYKAMLKLPDFSPASQDAIALQQIEEEGALAAIDTGNLEYAVGRCARIWASLPGAGYGQPEQKLTDLRTVYGAMGGKLRQDMTA